MNIKLLSKKLRHAADVLDELLVLDGNTNIARKIVKKIKRTKLHWTQRPENKAKLRRMLKKLRRTRNENS
jgi:hypothetical protein